MTTTVKVLLGCGSLLVIGAVFVIIALAGFIYYVESNPEYAKAEAEGTEFGKRVDQSGCMTEGFRRSKTISVTSFNELIANGTFVEACLAVAGKTTDFCKGVPPAIGNNPDWTTQECRKAGQEPFNSGCLGVTEAKQRFCN